MSRRANIADVHVFALEKYMDERGYVTESFNDALFKELIGENVTFISGHETFSRRDVLRGLHYQVQNPQSRLIRVSYGVIYEVALDLRKSSPTFGMWRGETLSSDSFSAMWIPAGVAHGYFVISEFALVNVYSDQLWNEAGQRCVRWDDKELAIDWPLYKEYPIAVPPTISERDSCGKFFFEADFFD